MSRIIDKLRSKAYYAYEGFLDETINKATKFLASSTTKFITSTFTIELNYDLEDLSSDTVLYPLKIIEKHFGNKKLTKNSYTDYYGERHLRPGTTYTEYFPNIRSFMTVHYPNREENSDNSISIFLWGKNPAQLEEFLKSFIITWMLIQLKNQSPIKLLFVSTDREAITSLLEKVFQ